MWDEVSALADSLPAFLSYVDAEGRYRFVNRTYEEWFGCPREALTGKHIREVLGEDMYSNIEPQVAAALAGQAVTFEAALRHHGGEIHAVQVAYSPRLADDGRVVGFFALVVDVTERKRAEEALRAIMEGTARATGDDFFQSLVTHLATALGVCVAFVCEYLDGNPTRVRALALSIGGEPREAFEYDPTGTPCAEVLSNRRLCFYPDRLQELFPDAPVPREAGARSFLAIPFFDAAGKAIGHMGVMDARTIVDEQRNASILRVFAARAGAELVRMRTEKALREREEQLRQSQRMEAIGTFASGIAHDLNNMLGSIRGYAELALPDVPQGSLPRENLQEVLLAADRAKAFVQQILLFGRPEPEEREVVQLRTVVGEVLGLLRASLPRGIEIRNRLLTEHDEVLGNVDQLRRVVLNLCTNAGQAMHRGGVLDLTIDRVAADPGYRTAVGSLEAQPYVRLTVGDTGPGIVPQIMPSLFEPFFTTKARGDGSGLGLAVVEHVVTAHGGAVAVRSEPGHGATFEVLLPPHPGATTPRALDDPGVQRGSGRLLLVDDDVSFLRMQTGMLESIGYEVVACTSGPEAVAAFAQAPEAFVAVVTDHSMPQMTGAVLARTLTGIRADIPIVLCTAFGRTVTPEVAHGFGVREYLAKPVSLRELAEALSRATDPTRGKGMPRGSDAGDRG